LEKGPADHARFELSEAASEVTLISQMDGEGAVTGAFKPGEWRRNFMIAERNAEYPNDKWRCHMPFSRREGKKIPRHTKRFSTKILVPDKTP
jgi:hypothetical protein